VEQQVAIMYATTTGLLDSVPVNRVRDFEKQFNTTLVTSHKDTLNALRLGKMDDSVTGVLKKVAQEVARSFAK
jgi:F-type H+-transporting ATPase subunit alpha